MDIIVVAGYTIMALLSGSLFGLVALLIHDYVTSNPKPPDQPNPLESGWIDWSQMGKYSETKRRMLGMPSITVEPADNDKIIDDMFKNRKSGRVIFPNMAKARKFFTTKPERKKQYTQAADKYDRAET